MQWQHSLNKQERKLIVLLRNSEELVAQAKIIDTCSRKPAGSASTGSTALYSSLFDEGGTGA